MCFYSDLSASPFYFLWYKPSDVLLFQKPWRWRPWGPWGPWGPQHLLWMILYKCSYYLLKFPFAWTQLVGFVHQRFGFDGPSWLTSVLQIKFWSISYFESQNWTTTGWEKSKSKVDLFRSRKQKINYLNFIFWNGDSKTNQRSWLLVWTSCELGERNCVTPLNYGDANKDIKKGH